jgi:hypothetical protein
MSMFQQIAKAATMVPRWQQPLHAIIARHFWPNPPARLNTWLAAAPFATDRLLRRRYGGSSDLQYVSMLEGLCNADGCLTRVGPDLFEDIESFDDGHLTLSASKYVADRIRPSCWNCYTIPASQQPSPARTIPSAKAIGVR